MYPSRRGRQPYRPSDPFAGAGLNEVGPLFQRNLEPPVRRPARVADLEPPALGIFQVQSGVHDQVFEIYSYFLGLSQGDLVVVHRVVSLVDGP